MGASHTYKVKCRLFIVKQNYEYETTLRLQDCE